jgi:signal transduction histidine kinase
MARQLVAVRLRPVVLLDVAVTAVVLAVSLMQLVHVGPPGLRVGTVSGHGDLDVVGVVLTAGSALPILVWRRWPLGVLTAAGVASVALAMAGHPLDLLVAPAAALYLLAAGRTERDPWTWRTTVAVGGLFLAYLGATGAATGAFPGSPLLHSGLAWAVAWFAGERTRLRRAQLAAFADRARRAEREAERERLLAAAEERARIARDLHDSVGHAISVIAVRAGAARLRHHREPDRTVAALAAIEELSRHTVAEIDQIVGGLRDDRPPDAAPIGLAALDALLAHRAAAGLAVTVETSGTPRPCGDTADQAAYRILQEALTNAARHGSGTARIGLVFTDTALELTVTNPVPAEPASSRRPGHGLTGMRERATLLGGDLDAGRTGGEFRIRARIPYRSHRP